MKISLAGDLGSGKSTVTDLLLAATGAERYTTGKIMRVLAAARGWAKSIGTAENGKTKYVASSSRLRFVI